VDRVVRLASAPLGVAADSAAEGAGDAVAAAEAEDKTQIRIAAAPTMANSRVSEIGVVRSSLHTPVPYSSRWQIRR
jgi:hypothetical protein